MPDFNAIRDFLKHGHTPKVLKSLAVFLSFITFYRVIYDLFLPLLSQNSHRIYPESFLAIGTFSQPYLALLGLVLLTPLVVFRKQLGWNSFQSPPLQWILLIIAVTLCWEMATYETNFFFNKVHFLDRCLLLTLFGAIYLHPGFFVPFLLQVLILRFQFYQPFGTYVRINILLPINILIFFSSYLYVRCFLKLRNDMVWTFLLSLTAFHYFVAGTEKLAISPHFYEWIFDYKIQFLPTSARAMGWTAPIFPEIAEALVQVTQNYGIVTNMGSLLLELLTLTILFTPYLTIVYLTALTLFHTTVFLLIGHLFWKWIVVLVCLGSIFLFLSSKRIKAIYSVENKILSLVLILVLTLVNPLYVPRLGWWETRSLYYFDWWAENNEGKRFKLDRQSFGNYALLFSFDFNKMTFMVNEKLLPDSTKNYYLAKILNQKLDSVDSYFELQEKYGNNYFDPRKKKILKAFIKRYVEKSQNTNNIPLHYLSRLQPPGHNYIYRGEDEQHKFNEIPGNITQVGIDLSKNFLRSDHVIQVKKRQILQVPISSKQ